MRAPMKRKRSVRKNSVWPCTKKRTVCFSLSNESTNEKKLTQKLCPHDLVPIRGQSAPRKPMRAPMKRKSRKKSLWECNVDNAQSGQTKNLCYQISLNISTLAKHLEQESPKVQKSGIYCIVWIAACASELTDMSIHRTQNKDNPIGCGPVQ